MKIEEFFLKRKRIIIYQKKRGKPSLYIPRLRGRALFLRKHPCGFSSGRHSVKSHRSKDYLGLANLSSIVYVSSVQVLAVVGTNRKQGNVAKICEEIIAGAGEISHRTEKINLYEFDIQHCLGCWRCHTLQKCFQQDDFEDIYDRIKTADAIILGSPVYWGNITGKMKTFFDRHMGYAMYNPEGALDFHKSRFWKKFILFHSELKKFGPRERSLQGKKFILVTASTLPFPYCYIKNEIPMTFKALDNYVIRMKGKTIARLAYTDTLFRFRYNKDKKILRKARKIGRELR